MLLMLQCCAVCCASGVGKTAIVEGLAQRIVSGDVPPGLFGSALLELDLAALAAGCMMPGEFEVGPSVCQSMTHQLAARQRWQQQ
jgi:ATP-dependent Clp protease ATP-binding subunit ClpA